MTTEELVVAIRVTAENAEETLESVKRAAEEMGASVKRIGQDAGGAFKPMTDGAMEAAAAQAALSAAAAAAFQTVIGAVKSGTEAYNAYTAAVKGLDSVANGRGIGAQEMNEALSGVTDAFFSATAAATAYKNLLSRGYSLEQATTTIKRLKDAAAYGRQANLSLEEAVVNATEGIRQENSVLVDNAGVTKNVAKMWEDYARARGLSAASLTQAQKVEAEYLGILEETAFQAGDLAKASQTLAGAQAEQSAQAGKLATAYGEAMAPAVQAVTQAGTDFLTAATGIVQQFPALTSGATSAAAAFTALVAAMKGISAVKGLLSALSIGSAALGPLAAVAGIVGLAATAYSAYAQAQEEAAQAEQQAAQEREEAKRKEKDALYAVNTELETLKTLYGQNADGLSQLAGEYDSGNDAIEDRIELLRAEQTAMLEKMRIETEAALAAKEAELERQKAAAQGLMQEENVFDFTGAADGFDIAMGDFTSQWQQGLENWISFLKTEMPEVTELAYQMRDALGNAESLEEAQTLYDEFLLGLAEGITTTQEEAEALGEKLTTITEGIDNPEGFDPERLYGTKGAKDAEKDMEALTEAYKEAEKQTADLTKKAQKLSDELEDNRGEKKRISAMKEQTDAAKKAGKGWENLSDDIKQYARENNVAEGDIDGLIAKLGYMEASLEQSAAAGVTEMQNLHAQLAALASQILAVPDLQLTGDPSALIAAIHAAMEEIEALLALMAAAGIAAGDAGTKRRGGGGGGGRRKGDSGGGYTGKSEEEKQREAYQEQIELLEHKRHLEQVTAREELEALEEIKRTYAKNAELVMDIDERIFDARKALREEEAGKITSLYDAITEALEERYEEQREIEQKRIDDSIEAWEKWADETTAAIREQIDAMEEQEEAQERQEEEAERLRKIEKLEASLPYEKDEFNRSQILQQIEQAKKELQDLYDDWAREDKKKELEAQIEAIEKKKDEEIGKLEAESERIDSVYDKLTDGASLAAEAQKLLMANNQEEILKLISNYAQDYEATGRSLGEKLFEGFKAAVGDITAYFAQIDAQFESMVERIQQSAFAESQKAQAEGQTGAQVSSPTVHQTVNFNQPVESAAQVAERMQEVSYELAAMM